MGLGMGMGLGGRPALGLWVRGADRAAPPLPCRWW